MVTIRKGGGDMSPEEIREILFYKPQCDAFVFDNSELKRAAYSKPKKKRKQRKMSHKRDRDGNILLKHCGDCMELKPPQCYQKNYNGLQWYCILCMKKRNTTCHNTVKGYIKKLCRHAKSRCKHRSNVKSRNDDSGKIDDNLFDLVVDLIENQNGRCAITGIPLEFKMNSRHGASLDRLDNQEGYIDGNIQLVVIPLNTRTTPSNSEIQKIRENYFQNQNQNE